MEKSKKKVLVDGQKLELSIENPEETTVRKQVEKRRVDKLNSMRMSLTYVESQQMMEVTPEQVIGYADKFLAWLEK